MPSSPVHRRTRRAAALGALILLLLVSGCSSTPDVLLQTSSPTPTPSATRAFVPGGPSWDACLALYEEMLEWRMKHAGGISAEGLCRSLIDDNDDDTLVEAFGDPAWIDAKRKEILGEVDPITPHYVVEFLGTGEAPVTWSGADTSMTQRVVTLPFSTEMPVQDYLLVNVVQIPASESGVGCRITLFSNDQRDGFVKDETLPVAGQTLASCSVD